MKLLLLSLLPLLASSARAWDPNEVPAANHKTDGSTIGPVASGESEHTGGGPASVGKSVFTGGPAAAQFQQGVVNVHGSLDSSGGKKQALPPGDGASVTVGNPAAPNQTIPDLTPFHSDPHALDALVESMSHGAAPASPTATSGPSQPLSPRELAAMNGDAAKAEAAGQNGAASLYSLMGGQPEKAEQQAQKALTSNADDPNALTALMLVRRQQGRGREAAELARRVLAVDPQNPVAKLVAGHADSLTRGAALEKKLAKLDFGKTADPGALDGSGAGAAGLSRGDAARAPDAGKAAGGGVLAERLPAKARPEPPVYDQAQPLTPAQQLVIRAVRRHEIGDEQGAMLALTQALDQDPKEAGAFVVRAEVDNSLTKYAAAIIDATKAVELAPTKPVLGARALRARAYAHLETRQWVEALADASRATELDPQSGLGYLYRAMAEDKLGRGTAAAADVAQAVKLDPALTPLAKPLLAKYGQLAAAEGPKRPDRRAQVAAGFVGTAVVLLAFGLRKLFLGSRLTTTRTPTPSV